MFARTLITALVAALALAASSVPVVSAQDGDPAAGGGSGSSDSGGGGSLPDLSPEDGEVCELPGLGGSVAKFYPLFGIEGIPAGIFDIITDGLDAFPNLLDMVAGEGRGAELLGLTGSLDESLCTSIFGGTMVLPPVTVIVDEDGLPVTTVTGTVARAAQASGSGSSQAVVTSVLADGVGDGAGAADDGRSRASADGTAADDGDPVVRPTSVPVP